jgi:serine/threonine protein kinase
MIIQDKEKLIMVKKEVAIMVRNPFLATYMQCLSGCLNLHQTVTDHAQKSLPSHPSLVRMYTAGICQLKAGYREALIVMEWCSGGSLAKYLENTTLSEVQALKMFYQIAKSISILHGLEKPIIHRDVKLEVRRVLSSASITLKLRTY